MISRRIWVMSAVLILTLALVACGRGSGEEPAAAGPAGGPAGGGTPAAGGVAGTAPPGSVDAFQAGYFPLSDVRRAELQSRFPVVNGTVDGPVEKLTSSPFFRFALKTDRASYKVEGVPESSYAANLFVSPIIHADKEPQPGDKVTVFGELYDKEGRLVANYVAVEGKGVWFYRSFFHPLEIRAEINDLYDGLPVAAKGMINSLRPQGDFYQFDASRSIASRYVGSHAIFVGTFRKSDPVPYIELTGIYVQEGATYTPILQ